MWKVFYKCYQTPGNYQYYVRWTLLFCAVFSTLWNTSLRLYQGQQGTLCEYSQSDRSVLRCMMALTQSMTFSEYVRVYICVHANTVSTTERPLCRKGQRWKKLDQRKKKAEKRMEKFEAGKTDFLLWSGVIKQRVKDGVTGEQVRNKRNRKEDTKVKERRFSTSTALKGVALFCKYIHCQMNCAYNITYCTML